MPIKRTKQQAFDYHVIRLSENECWPASGGGYNKPGWHVTWRFEGRRALAHRVSWELHRGPIPGKLCVLHHCDNPKCCNPNHLFLGTRADNVADMHAKQRARHGDHTGRKFGPSKGRKVSNADIPRIHELYVAGKTQRVIGAIFGVTDVTIGNILRGRIYEEAKKQVAGLGRGVKQAAGAFAKKSQAKRLRADGLTQYEIAALLSVSQTTVSHYLKEQL